MKHKGFIEFGNGLFYDPSDGSIYSYQGKGIYRFIKKMGVSELPREFQNYVLREITPKPTHRVSRGKEVYIDPKHKGEELYVQECGLDKNRNIVWELVCDKNGIPVKFLESDEK